MLQVNLFLPRSIFSNLGQFFLALAFAFAANKKYFCHLRSSLYPLPSLLASPTIPSLLFQHPNLYSFYLNAYLGSLEPQTFGFPLDSGPDALPLSHADLDASSTILLITYTL